MEMMESIRAAFKEMILPEIGNIKEEYHAIGKMLEITNKRLDDMNGHLVDQGRRIDETNKRIDSVREELAKKIADVRQELTLRLDQTNQRIDETNHKIVEMGDKFGNRMDHLYEVIVRREEHQSVVMRLTHLEQQIQELKLRLAA